MRFDKILIMGTGKIASECVKHLTVMGLSHILKVVEIEKVSLSTLAHFCEKRKIFYSSFRLEDEIESVILKLISDERALIISANNRYIFPATIINKKNVEIINYHYSLLPRYRGMNIPSWVIYNNEKKTGITWHFVTQKIDDGKIICQKEIEIKDDTTAYDITRKGMILAMEAFKEFIDELLIKKISGMETVFSADKFIYRNRELPRQGILDLDLSLKEMYRLLRCFDYGAFEVIPKLCVEYQGKKYKIIGYSYKEGADQDTETVIMWEDNTLIVKKDGGEIRMALK